MPANRRIVQLSESGAGEVIEDNRYAIASEIVDRGGMNTPPSLKTPPREEGMMIGGPEEPLPPIAPRSDGGGGCAVVSGPAAPASTGAVSALLGLAALMGLGRRRA
jgi:MYXO-CTERM domain-containing protein